MRKQKISLLEVLLVLFLLSSIGGFFSWNFYEKYKEDLFLSEQIKFRRWIEMLHFMAAFHKEDLFCTFSPHQKKWQAKAGFLEGKGFLSEKPSHKESFEKVQFFFNKKKKAFTLHFSSTGKISPKGEVSLYLDKKRQKRIKIEDLFRFKEEACNGDFFLRDG